MRIHLIAVGGAVMHNLAIALKKSGHHVSGSDDEIYNPAKDRLLAHGLLPKQEGWDRSRITSDIDRIILGMHAHLDNPELQEAQKINLKVQSFPEFIAEFAADKIRVVIAGSHGKTTTTSMIMHVLDKASVEFDYLVGAGLEGFEDSVRLSDAPVIILEGDEYLSSRIDPVPKIWHYAPQIAVITGIAWDHLNVFPTFERYVDAFRQFVDRLPEPSQLFYYGGNKELQIIVEGAKETTTVQAYKALPYDGEKNAIVHNDELFTIKIFGKHNLENLHAALLVCKKLGVSDRQFFDLISTFKGAKKRLELITTNQLQSIFVDYAHSPSKVQATTNAVKHQFKDQKLVVVFELHTYSSLNRVFLPQYAHTLNKADEVFLFIDPQALKIKRMEPISDEVIERAFQRADLNIIRNAKELNNQLIEKFDDAANYLLMSSGHFGGAKLDILFKDLIN